MRVIWGVVGALLIAINISVFYWQGLWPSVVVSSTAVVQSSCPPVPDVVVRQETVAPAPVEQKAAAPAKRWAFATIFTRDTAQYSILACSLGLQLLRWDPAIPRFMLALEGMTMSHNMSSCGWTVQFAAEKEPQNFKNCTPRSFWPSQFLKLEFLRYETFDKVLYLDADTAVLQSLKSVFEDNDVHKHSPVVGCDMVQAPHYYSPPFTFDNIFNGCTLLFTPCMKEYKRFTDAVFAEPPSSWSVFRCTELGFLNVMYPHAPRFVRNSQVCFDPLRFVKNDLYRRDISPTQDLLMFHNMRYDNVDGRQKEGWYENFLSLDTLWVVVWRGILAGRNHLHIANNSMPEIIAELESGIEARVMQRNRQWTAGVNNWLDDAAMKRSRFRYGCPEVCVKFINNPLPPNTLLQVDFLHILMSYMTGITRLTYLEIGVSVGKTFSSTFNFLDEVFRGRSTAVALDIEDITRLCRLCLVEDSKNGGYTTRAGGTRVHYCVGSEMEPKVWNSLKSLGLRFNVVFSDALHTGEATDREQHYLTSLDLLDTSSSFLWFWDDCEGDIQTTFRKACARAREKTNGVSCRTFRLHSWLGENEGRHTTCVISTIPLEDFPEQR